MIFYENKLILITVWWKFGKMALDCGDDELGTYLPT